ncbi:MAG TPA: F0F1 ATP synthase subunit A [Chthonomonadaceae bacterium]|nr:F0F1 ATP synthase subunit A [Chthonomonadaceae bacterium]
MHISPDSIVYWHSGFWNLNSTIVTTWGLMLFMTLGSWLVTRRLATGVKIPRWQNLLEILVGGMRQQLRETGLNQPEKYLPFIGTLFLFIAISNLCSILSLYEPPTGSLSTTAGLAIAVFLAVPLYGIAEQGIGGYFGRYLKPTPLMLPFNIIGDFSRTLALAVRLFGNIMSGSMIVGILLTITPLFFPILMLALGLLTGMVQAYIFAVLATVYIAAATHGEAD